MNYPICHFFNSFLNLFKHRDRITIIGDILKTVKNRKDGAKPSHIMQNARLSYPQTKKYLSYLVSCGLLVVTEKRTYVITEKGTRFLQLIEAYKIHTLR